MRRVFRVRAREEEDEMNKILTANLSETFPVTRRLYASDGDTSPSCCSWVPLFTISFWIYVHICAGLPRVTDGRARMPRVRFPFEFARCIRRIKYQNSISSGIAILRDSPMVPLSTPHILLSSRSSIPLPFYIEARAACIISTWMRVRRWARGASGDICGFSLWENNRLLRGYNAHLQSENSLKMSLPIMQRGWRIIV